MATSDSLQVISMILSKNPSYSPTTSDKIENFPPKQSILNPEALPFYPGMVFYMKSPGEKSFKPDSRLPRGYTPTEYPDQPFYHSQDIRYETNPTSSQTGGVPFPFTGHVEPIQLPLQCQPEAHPQFSSLPPLPRGVQYTYADSSNSGFGKSMNDNGDPCNNPVDGSMNAWKFFIIDPDASTQKPWRGDLQHIFNSLPNKCKQQEFIEHYALGYRGDSCPSGLSDLLEQAFKFGMMEKSWDVDVEGSIYRMLTGISSEGEINGVRQYQEQNERQ